MGSHNDKMPFEVIDIIIDDDDFEKKRICDREYNCDEMASTLDDANNENPTVDLTDSQDDVPSEPNDETDMEISHRYDNEDIEGFYEAEDVERFFDESDEPENSHSADEFSIEKQEEKKGKKGFFSNLSTGKRIQLVVSVLLTIGLVILIPTYAWFYNQREIARLERIKSPDSLYITAANREDKINIKMDEIDVNSTWNETSNERSQYKYFVFAVAGQYVVNYNLQLAHTKNNNYKYEIFEADASNTQPEGVEGKDYVVYTPDESRVPLELRSITVHDGINTAQPIYYCIKQDNSDQNISLNSGLTYSVGAGASARTYSYDGHYINMVAGSEYTALANSTYHEVTYSYDKVEPHSEPLYWQVTNIPVIDPEDKKNAFYHEYILKVSWDTTANLADLKKYKDTDIVYITVSVQ